VGLGALLARGHAAPLPAQRPAPPRDWRVDTTDGRPVALRRGGMLSTETRAELVGPFATQGEVTAVWLDGIADRDAATIGSARPEGDTRAAASTLDGVAVIMAARQVRTTGYDRWLGYAVMATGGAGEPRFVVRLTSGDGLTLARVLRSGVAAMLPYLREPTVAMRAAPVRAVAMADPAATRAVPRDSVAARRTGDATASRRSGGTSATGTGTRGTSTPATSRIDPAWGPPVQPGAGGRYLMHLEYGSGGTGGVYTMVGYWLRDDGWAVRDPDAIAADFDVTAHRRAHPDDWFRWRRITPRTIELAAHDGSVDTDDQWMELRPLAPGATLDGGWRATSSFSTPDMATASASLSQVMIFRSDGTFRTNAGALAQSGGATAAGGRRDGGRYRVLDATTIELQWHDGRVVRALALFAGGKPGERSTVMILNGVTYYDL
jgi:hypothetical protein